MFRNEREFVQFVASALHQAGHQVQREVALGRHRVDLLATKDKIRRGIEAKLSGHGLLDDLTKSRELLRLSDVDEMYACGPKMFMSDDVRAFAAQLGVGLLAVSDTSALEWLALSRRLRPAQLVMGGGYSALVFPGGEAAYHAAVFNNGEKTAINVEVSMLPVGAFSAPRRSMARAQRSTLDGGERWEVTVVCKVKKGTRPAKHPLMVTVKADNAPRHDSTIQYEIRPAQ